VNERLSVHRLAELELLDSIAYYELESPGLGNAFLVEVERCFERILQNPLAGTVLRGQIRRRLVRRFPFGVLYVVQPHSVRVLAIMSLRRRPWYWAGRS
jgi:plasmid stabilization system protein ParE